jgi:oligopeptide/dipeptide ABC transporter ATP-binding protein
VIPAEQPLVQATHLHKRFAAARRGSYLHAVDDVSFSIARGESVGLVGESGCGKSTLVRLLTRILDPDEGRILFAGRDLTEVPARAFARHPDRARIQQVFQDAGEALDPRDVALHSIAEPLRRLGGLRGAELSERVGELADDVALPRELLGRYPHQLSGGQKARVGLARALALRPELLVLDEPTASLDVSVQAVILQLLAALRERHRVTYLFVTHDLSLVRLLCDRVLVMYLGQVVESGPVERVFRRPGHPYTRALLGAVPTWRAVGAGTRIRLVGEPQSPIDPRRDACRLVGRCPLAEERCGLEAPAAVRLRDADVDAGGDHRAACHFALEPNLTTHALGVGDVVSDVTSVAACRNK